MPLPEPAAGEHFVHSPVPDRSVASTERIQHLDRQTLQPAYPGLPVLCVAWHPTLSAVLLAAPTADSSHPTIDTGLYSALSHCRRLERSPPTISTCFTYPLPISRSDVLHTRCTVGSSSGRPDRPGGMYPLRVGVTMSLHKLTAGSGYDYLTRQVAALGCDRERSHRAGVVLHRTG